VICGFLNIYPARPHLRTKVPPFVYWNFAYSALACFRMGLSGSASLQGARKSLCWAAFTHRIAFAHVETITE